MAVQSTPVSRATSASAFPALARHEGQLLLSAPGAMLKGMLEAETEVGMVAGPRGSSLGSLLDLAEAPAVAQLLRGHNLRLVVTSQASRGLTLAAALARSGRAGFAIVPNDQLDDSMESLRQACSLTLDRGGALGIILEDDPRACPPSCPRRAVMRVALPCIEAADVAQLRDAMEQLLRLSRAGRAPVAVIVHRSILASSDTLEVLPNRVMDPVQSVLVRRRRPRTPRWSESGGALRMARRMELNRLRAMPSPGERITAGFIAIGPALNSILHLTHTFGLHGRVPILQLGLIQPMDEPAVERLLLRCQQVIVLEPRPGSVESSVVMIAEAMRRRGEQPASVWGRILPADPGGAEQVMSSDDDLHPSVLVRKIAHLLHAIRPTVQVAAQLMSDPPALAAPVPPRETQMGINAALGIVRRIVTDVDQWLRGSAPLEERGVPPTTLAIDGAEPVGASGRIVMVETWDHRGFVREGLAALVQAAYDGRPWIFLVHESASEEIRDLERLARGAAPAERADRVTLEVANLNDRVGLRDTIREAALADRLTVVIVRDGPPPRYDAGAIERKLTEIDRLGFEPRQRVVHPADDVCAIRPLTEIEPLEMLVMSDAESLEPIFSAEKLLVEAAPKFRARLRPLQEEVEVLRTRPPLRAWQTEPSLRLTPPQPLHARQPMWRAHLAGFRGRAPGAAAHALCEAGRLMGYHVRSIHDERAVGPGRRAWTQILFTHPREGEGPLQIAPTIPYGEADLLLGLDSRETLRAIAADPSLRVAHGDRTFMVINLDQPSESADQPIIDRALLTAAVAGVTRPQPRSINDYLSACRTWFYTDRVADMAMLGAAFQLGLIPVTVEAIEQALSEQEARGFGRSREAFEFGRRSTVDARLFSRPRENWEEDVNRIARRMVLSLSRRAWGSGLRATRFRSIIHGSLESMPGLMETEPGRQARRDFVMALYRCVAWGGIAYAQRFADLIARLYLADRGDRGRMLTRNAVLPLAEAMLMRDPIYIATMAASSEQRRRTRQQMNVKEARGDRLERRYLTRLELIAFNRRLRADVRSSDWPARVVAMARRIMPLPWRGTMRERELRDYVIGVVERAIEAPPEEYDRWSEALARLHNQAAEDRLRGMALAEVRMLVEPAAGMMPAAPSASIM